MQNGGNVCNRRRCSKFHEIAYNLETRPVIISHEGQARFMRRLDEGSASVLRNIVLTPA